MFGAKVSRLIEIFHFRRAPKTSLYWSIQAIHWYLHVKFNKRVENVEKLELFLYIHPFMKNKSRFYVTVSLN